ncbi:MAG TPA: ADP-forming succinate--CoA ligase subunit beta [Gammaproteobacteria bacterium]|nr:ADP-forming succinate--CoA ligase subunit beta [Gammaproteobacteria bacterium]
MHLHEFQAKELFAQYGIPVPAASLATSVGEVALLAHELGGDAWVAKAQVHAGGRGKAGGVRRVEGVEALQSAVSQLLGTRLVTAQTGPAGQPVHSVLIEKPCDIARELYLGAVVDRSLQRVVFMASAAGGMDIEDVARERPDDILRVAVDPVVGLQPYQCRQLAFGLGLGPALITPLTRVMEGLYRLFTERDLSLVEINPLVVTGNSELLALDAKVNADDNALYRQKALNELHDPTQEDEKEYRAQQHGLNYVSLDGNIACMVNGAGLAMATMDLIKLHGGEPANFLDVGGGTTAEKVAEAFKLILSDTKVKAILVNIFGGIVRCDLIAEGIIRAVEEVQLNVPVVVRLEGTNVEQGREMLQSSELSIVTAQDLTDAAQKAVHAAGTL